MPAANPVARRSRIRSLMLKYLAAWLAFGLAVYLFIAPLNRITVPVLGTPLGYFVAAQGALVAFVLMLLTFARHRDDDGR
jgi:putative solute:sodium symporter small subunit